MKAITSVLTMKIRISTITILTIRPILNRMGYARSIPHAIVYGPKILAGIGLRSFYDEMGSSKMELV